MLAMNRRGMGLVEMTVAGAITAVVGTAVYALISTGHRAWSSSDAAIALEDRMRQAFTVISEGLRSSGNQAGAIRVRIDNFDAPCPNIVYQVPLEAGGYGAAANAWGALNAPSPPTADGAVWIHRTSNLTGGGVACQAGNLLVQRVMQNWTAPTWNGSVWTAVGTTDLPGSQQSIRVLAHGVELFEISARNAGGLNAGTPLGSTLNWPPAFVEWTGDVYQVQVRLRLRQPAALGPPATLDRIMRVQLRNRYRPAS